MNTGSGAERSYTSKEIASILPITLTCLLIHIFERNCWSLNSCKLLTNGPCRLIINRTKHHAVFLWSSTLVAFLNASLVCSHTISLMPIFLILINNSLTRWPGPSQSQPTEYTLPCPPSVGSLDPTPWIKSTPVALPLAGAYFILVLINTCLSPHSLIGTHSHRSNSHFALPSMRMPGISSSNGVITVPGKTCTKLTVWWVCSARDSKARVCMPRFAQSKSVHGWFVFVYVLVRCLNEWMQSQYKPRYKGGIPFSILSRWYMHVQFAPDCSTYPRIWWNGMRKAARSDISIHPSFVPPATSMTRAR